MPRLLLATLLLVSVLVPAAAFAQTSSCACLGTPTDVVDQWSNMYPSGNTDNLCSNNCHTWSKTCNTMIAINYRCLLVLFSSLAALDVAECGNLMPPDKGNCIRSAQDNLRSMNSSLTDDLNSAREDCIDLFFDCFNDCSYD